MVVEAAVAVVVEAAVAVVVEAAVVVVAEAVVVVVAEAAVLVVEVCAWRRRWRHANLVTARIYCLVPREMGEVRRAEETVETMVCRRLRVGRMMVGITKKMRGGTKVGLGWGLKR
jgi:hypothetical protein